MEYNEKVPISKVFVITIIQYLFCINYNSPNMLLFNVDKFLF